MAFRRRSGQDLIALAGGWLVWLLPAVVFLVVTELEPRHVQTLVGVVCAVGLVAIAARFPGPAIVALAIGLPFQLIVLSTLYQHGLVPGLVRPLGGWKEVLVAGVLIAGAHAVATTSRRLDRLDKLALAFMAVVACYHLAPRLFTPGASVAAEGRVLAARELLTGIVLFLAARHAPLAARTGRRLATVTLVAGGVVAGLALVEFMFSSGWNDFLVRTIGVSRYQIEVLGVALRDPFDLRIYGTIGSRQFVRSGSVWLGPGGLAFHMLLPLGVVLHRMVTARATAAVQLVGGLCGAALMLSITRSAVLAALVMVLVALGPRTAGTGPGRVRATLVLLAVLVLVLPTVGGSTIGQRTAGVVNGDDTSAPDHWESLSDGIESVARRPLGNGLGTTTGEGERFGSGASVVTENAYLDVATEVGLPAMVLFVLLVLGAIAALGRVAARPGPLADTAGWVRLSLIGMAIAGLLLPVFTLLLSLMLWGAVGVALNRTEQTAAPPTTDQASVVSR